MRLKGKVLKQVNNLKIRRSDVYQYSVWAPDGKCLEDRFPTLSAAEAYCRETKDYKRR